MTLAKKFKALRTARKDSLADVGKACGLARTTIWKIEHGYHPEGDTLQRACLQGLGLSKSSKDWQEIMALWTSETTGQGTTAQSLAGEMSRTRKKAGREMDAFLEAVSKLPHEEWAQLEKAVTRPSVMRGLASLNAIFEG
jgi:transcriptional regulator with XRE-family HTH domain